MENTYRGLIMKLHLFNEKRSVVLVYWSNSSLVKTYVLRPESMAGIENTLSKWRTDALLPL